MLKKLGLFVASLLTGVSLYAAVAAGPAGSFINNQNTLQQGATFYISSGTVRNLQTTTLRFNDGTTMTTAASGTGGTGSAGPTAYGSLYTSSGAINQTGITTTLTKLSFFSSAGISTHAVSNATTDTITVATTGVFNVYAVFTSTDFFISANRLRYYICVNDVPSNFSQSFDPSYSATAHFPVSITGILSLNTGDSVSLCGYVDTTTGQGFSISDAQLIVSATGGIGGTTIISGGSSTTPLGVFKNGVQVSSPTSQINFSGNYWDITLGGTSTGTVKLIGGNTNYIQVSNSLQTGATAYPQFLNANTATIISSITVLGANGASVTYGVTAGSVTVNNLTASQFVKTDANKRLSSQAQISLASDVTGTLSASNFVSTAAYTVSTQTFSGVNTFSSMTVNKEINISSGSAETKLTSLWQSGSTFNGYLKTNGRFFAGKDNGASNIDGIMIDGANRQIRMGNLGKAVSPTNSMKGTNFFNDIANNYIVARTTGDLDYIDASGYSTYEPNPGVFNILGSYDTDPSKTLFNVGYVQTIDELTSYGNVFRITYSDVTSAIPIYASAFHGNGSNLTNIVNVSSLSATGVTAGSYTNTNLTVDAQGRITAASNGSAGGGGGIASMRVEDGGSFVVDTSTFDFTGTQFNITNSGGEALIALNGSSVTLGGVLTAGSNITITPGSGITTIAATGGGTSIYPATATASLPIGFSASTGVFTSTVTLGGNIFIGPATPIITSLGSTSMTYDAGGGMNIGTTDADSITIGRTVNASIVLRNNGWNIVTISNSAMTVTTMTVTGSVTSTTGFVGNGSLLSNLTPLSLSAGSLPTNVIASSFTATGVTAGSYTNTNLTVDAQGRITAASNGSAGGGGSAVSSFTYTFPASQANLPGANAPYISNSTNAASAGVFFDEISTQTVTWATMLNNYNGGTLYSDIIYTSSATSGTMNWGVYIECKTPSADALDYDTDSFSTVNSTSVTVGATSGMAMKATTTLTNGDSCANGDTVRIKLERRAGETDTAIGKGRVRFLRLYE